MSSDTKINTLDVTVSHSDNDFDFMINFLNKYCNNWGFDHEKGEITGYHHWQVRCVMKEKKRLQTWINDFIEKGLKDFKASVTSNENKNNFDYVLKESTRVEGPWLKSTYTPYTNDVKKMLSEGLKLWQQEILDSFEVEDLDIINVLLDEGGFAGKSTLFKYAFQTQKAFFAPSLNSYGKLVEFMCKCHEKLKPFWDNKNPAVLLDIPRAINPQEFNEMWSGIEHIKSGILFDTRYTAVPMTADRPVMWVLTNKVPNPAFLSVKRWKLWNIDASGKLFQVDIFEHYKKQRDNDIKEAHRQKINRKRLISEVNEENNQ